MCSSLTRALVCRALLAIAVVVSPAVAQQTNRVDRQVTNPITDTPNVNPLTQDVTPPPAATTTAGDPVDLSLDELKVTARRQEVSGPQGAQVYVYEGDVDARIGVYRMQSDKVTVFEATNKLLAEGNVVFDQEGVIRQRITGSRAEFNYAAKLGHFENSTGFTNQTQDGTVIYFTADRVERVRLDTLIATNVEVTACEDIVPKWSFRAGRAEIKTNDRVRLTRPSLRVKELPVVWLPYASVPIKRRDRASGFLTPTFSYSSLKGVRLSGAYYQTLGRSADVTLRGDVYSERGYGIGADVRTRANSRSFFDFGFFAVRDRVFGKPQNAENPDQGGSSFYADGVHYFPNGFLAAAKVNITSNLAFRQVFSDNVQLVISPDERSQVFINKNFSDYSFNFLARTQVTSIPNVRVRTRQLPSVTLEKRPAALDFFRRHPVYFSFSTSFEGVSRKETVEDIVAFRNEVGGEPLVTPSIVQRLDLGPRLSMPFYYKGWSATATVGARATYYSNTIDPATRLVLGRDTTRGLIEFEGDLRPPALARNFYRADKSLRFRHVVEPYITYRKIGGANSFRNVIRFDYLDTIADTNEIEYGITNRFFTRRSINSVGGRSSSDNVVTVAEDGRVSGADSPDAEDVPNTSGDSAVRRATNQASNQTSGQPNEILSITLRSKYFFDPTFGGALIPGRRNQFYPLTTFSGFTYGGVPRRFSPLAVEARYRPASNFEADVRTDLDTQGGGFRNLSVSFGLNRPYIQAYQTYYYTRTITLAPSLARFADPAGDEPGTLRGSQWSPSIFVGNRERGVFGGLSFFFDFQNRPGRGGSSLISSTETIGYAFDCCAITVQHYSFNVGLRNENRFLFGFRLNGIGSFGTDQIGQRFR